MENRCKIAGGIWNSSSLNCICSNGGTFNTTTGVCECGVNQKLENGKCVTKLNTDLSQALKTNTSINLLNANETTRSVTARGVTAR